jgi:ribonuclease P protein component
MVGSRGRGSAVQETFRKNKSVVSGRQRSDLPDEPIGARAGGRGAGDVSPRDMFPRDVFPRSQRLLSHASFQDVYRKGRRQFSPHLTVFHLPHKSSGDDSGKNHAGIHAGPRIGLAVASALGGAVVRNRIRRRLRAAVRPNLHQLTAPVDVVIQAKKSVLVTEFLELVSEIENAFKVIESQARNRGTLLERKSNK